MSYTPVPTHCKWPCRRCKSTNLEFREHDETCDINYYCLACNYYWWVDGEDS